MTTNSVCNLINRTAVAKAASILEVDVATAMVILNNGNALDRALNNEESLQYKALLKKYKGQTPLVYQALAILTQWKLNNPEIYEWRHFDGLDSKIDIEKQGNIYILLDKHPIIHSNGNIKINVDVLENYSVKDNIYSIRNLLLSYDSSKSYYILLINPEKLIKEDDHYIITKNDYKYLSAESILSLTGNPVNNLEAIKAIGLTLLLTKGIEVIPLHNAENHSSELFDEIIDTYEKDTLNRIKRAQIIWAHPATGKTFLHNQQDNNIIDFDSVYKSKLDTLIGISPDPEYKNERKKWRQEHPEEYKQLILQLFDEAVSEAKNTNKKLLVSDIIILQERANDLDLITDIDNDIFVQRNVSRESTTVENSIKWKNNINRALKNLKGINRAKVVKYNGYISDLLYQNPDTVNPEFSIFRTIDGIPYGIAYKNKIYLNNTATLSLETPIHEYTHLWCKAMQYNNPEGWQSIKNILRDTPEWNEIANYLLHQEGINDENLIASELLAQYSGKVNEGKLINKDSSFIDKIKTALGKFWNWVGLHLFNIKQFKNIDEITDRVLYDLLNQTDLELPDTNDILIDPTSVQVQNYNVSVQELINFITGIDATHNHIMRQSAFNKLSEKGYSKEYLYSIINSVENVNKFLTYFNEAKNKRHLTDENLTETELETLYLDAILSLLYSNYISALENKTQYVVSSDSSAHNIATDSEKFIVNDNGKTINFRIEIIKALQNTKIPVLDENEDWQTYLPDYTPKKIIEDFNTLYKQNGHLTKLQEETYLHYTVIIPLLLKLFELNPAYLQFLENTSTKFTDSSISKQSIFTNNMNIAKGIADIINMKNKTAIHEEPAEIISPKNKEGNTKDKIEKLVTELRKTSDDNIEVINCWNGPKALINPFGTSSLSKFKVEKELVNTYFLYGLKYIQNDTEDIPIEALTVFDTHPDIVKWFKDTYALLETLIENNKKVIFVYSVTPGEESTNYVSILRNLYTNLYNKKYRPEIPITIQNLYEFNPEYIADNLIKEKPVYVGEHKKEMTHLLELLEYIYTVQHKLNPELLASNILQAVLSGNKKAGLQVLSLTTKQTQFIALLEHLGYMTKTKLPDYDEEIGFNFLEFWGGLDITRDLQEQLENKYLEEIGLKTALNYITLNKLSKKAEQWLINNNVIKNSNGQFQINENTISLLKSNRTFLFNEILKVDRKLIAREILNTYYSNQFVPIKKRVIYTAGIITPKTLKSRFNLDEKGLPLIDAKFFKNLTKSRYNLKSILTKDSNDNTIVNADFVVRTFSSRYNIVFVDNFTSIDTTMYGEPIDPLKIIIQDGYRIHPKTGEKMYKLPSMNNIMICKNQYGEETILLRKEPSMYKIVENILTSDPLIITVQPFLNSFSHIGQADLLVSILKKIKNLINTISVFDDLLSDLITGLSHTGYTPEETKLLCIDFYLNPNTKKKYEDTLAEATFIAFQNSQELIALRIPTLSLQSIMALTVKGYTNDKGNNVFVTRWQFWLQGSKFNISKLA